MIGGFDFEDAGDHRLRLGGLLDAEIYQCLDRICFLSPFRFFVEAGLNGPDYARPGLLDAVQVAAPLLTQKNRDYWTGCGLVIADASGRVRVGGIDEDIDGLQEWLCFRYGYRMVSPVLGEPWRWFRI